jgi:hypothetical protein
MESEGGIISTGKTPDSYTRASGNSTNSHKAANQEELGEGNYAFEVYLLILRSDIYIL